MPQLSALEKNKKTNLKKDHQILLLYNLWLDLFTAPFFLIDGEPIGRQERLGLAGRKLNVRLQKAIEK